MTIKWVMLIVLGVLAALWVVYMALKAFNGILYELSMTRAYLDEDK